MHPLAILIFYLVCVAEQTGLSLTLLESQKTGFLVEAHISIDDMEQLIIKHRQKFQPFK